MCRDFFVKFILDVDNTFIANNISLYLHVVLCTRVRNTYLNYVGWPRATNKVFELKPGGWYEEVLESIVLRRIKVRLQHHNWQMISPRDCKKQWWIKMFISQWKELVHGHSNYQIGPNRCKSDQIGVTYYQSWTLRPQLQHCIRSTFSLYWIIWILNIRVQNWLNIATHTYDNRNVRNKGDDEVQWWLRPKVIIMVPIWKCVGLTPIWSNFADVHHFYTHFKNYLLLFYWFSDHLLIEKLTVTVPMEPNPAISYLSDTVFNLYLIKWSWFW